MKLSHSVLLVLPLLFLRPLPAAAVDQGALYQRHCASCHEDPNAQPPLPSQAEFRQMPARLVLEALQPTGVMKKQGAALTQEEKVQLAEFLTVKSLAAPSYPAEKFRCPGRISPELPAGPAWTAWGADLSNSRFQPFPRGGLDGSKVGKLTLKWAFGFRDDEPYSQPSVAGGKLFVATKTGKVYALDAKTGCVYWTYQAPSWMRTAIQVSTLKLRNRVRSVLYFGDFTGAVYCLEADTGRLVWKTQVEKNQFAKITAAPALYQGRLYVPVSSVEEQIASGAGHTCCTFRGSLAALDAGSGKILWHTYAIAEQPRVLKTVGHRKLLGPAGDAIWSSPTIDEKLHRVYAATGNTYSGLSRNSDAILAFNTETGKLLWSHQVTPKDIYVGGCKRENTGAPANPNCPAKDDLGDDLDFGSPPILRSLPDGRRVLVASQKSGTVYGMNPDRDGALVWKTDVSGGVLGGGIQWGAAADESKVYLGVSKSYSATHSVTHNMGMLAALSLADGSFVWKRAPAKASCGHASPAECNPSISAAVSALPGAVLVASFDGKLSAYSTTDGALLWSTETNRSFSTVNSVDANGGSFDGNGGSPVVVDGFVYINSGYPRHGIPGNVLLGFGLEK